MNESTKLPISPGPSIVFWRMFLLSSEERQIYHRSQPSITSKIPTIARLTPSNKSDIVPNPATSSATSTAPSISSRPITPSSVPCLRPCKRAAAPPSNPSMTGSARIVSSAPSSNSDPVTSENSPVLTKYPTEAARARPVNTLVSRDGDRTATFGSRQAFIVPT
mmetsp:Transcript_6165/g.3617  ORF Transcript_6165/g.3617 Transcript_6165/m.3617 type:complete len:164 (-) Transcript_6165:47-538(-)